MLNYSIHDKHIKKDSWVKDMTKTFNPELLSELIKKRIEYPASAGPYVRRDASDELPTDIIDAFIADNEEFRKKLEPAVGLLLYKMMHGKMTENHDILRGIFSIIRESKLTECRKLVSNWLVNKYEAGSRDPKWKHTYRDGMMAYAQIQTKDKTTEEWWSNIWKESSSAWWPAAFLGLRIQNPKAACDELPLLISRNTEKATYLLVGMWTDIKSRGMLERAIKRGLDENTGWGGLALNMILERLTEVDRNKIMLNLRDLNKPPQPKKMQHVNV
jgi:hypothetical protein